MLRTAFQSAFGRRRRPSRSFGAHLHVTLLESRTTPTTLLVNPKFMNDPAHHRFNTIQGAVDAAKSGDNIRVQSGTYKEAVTITKSDIDLFADGKDGSVRIQAPAGSDIAVHVDGGATKVDIVGFTITGANAGIQFGDHFDSPATASGSGSAVHDTVFGYAQVGIEVIGTGSKAELSGDIVRGPGSAGAANAPIGIQVSDGARAEVEGDIVSNNLGNSTNEGVGILVLQTSNVEVEHNVVFGNDEGILLASFPGATRVTDTEV
ncbi:MAG TPA: right-handed parallel beta-helix repeat-containing protein, partial [Gemmataceae bacterium]|nr:right-handed parallel beta-helix repeat-containing protein [Gemmataceae bacterium]